MTNELYDDLFVCEIVDNTVITILDSVVGVILQLFRVARPWFCSQVVNYPGQAGHIRIFPFKVF